MNKEKLLQVLSEALDKGVYLTVHMKQYNKDFSPVDKETANDFMNQFKESLGTNAEIENDTDGETHSFDLRDGDFTIYCSYVPEVDKEYLQEDVKLDGMGEEHYAAS